MFRTRPTEIVSARPHRSGRPLRLNPLLGALALTPLLWACDDNSSSSSSLVDIDDYDMWFREFPADAVTLTITNYAAIEQATGETFAFDPEDTADVERVRHRLSFLIDGGAFYELQREYFELADKVGASLDDLELEITTGLIDSSVPDQSIVLGIDIDRFEPFLEQLGYQRVRNSDGITTFDTNGPEEGMGDGAVSMAIRHGPVTVPAISAVSADGESPDYLLDGIDTEPSLADNAEIADLVRAAGEFHFLTADLEVADHEGYPPTIGHAASARFGEGGTATETVLMLYADASDAAAARTAFETEVAGDTELRVLYDDAEINTSGRVLSVRLPPTVESRMIVGVFGGGAPLPPLTS
jgi:hypothetical protein